ncbi:MAG: hypothetical protein JKY65_31220, partial [Planctomycetes bacterium]|nr:hypothetical protein [Planctomycetota bacterium]
MPLLPCPRCERHIRADEAKCPFCSNGLSKAGWAGAAALGLAVLAGCPA